MRPEFQPPETCTLLLSLKDAARFAENLHERGFEKHEKIFQFYGPEETYSTDMLEDDDGKVVIIERREDVARVEMASEDFVELSELFEFGLEV